MYFWISANGFFLLQYKKYINDLQMTSMSGVLPYLFAIIIHVRINAGVVAVVDIYWKKSIVLFAKLI